MKKMIFTLVVTAMFSSTAYSITTLTPTQCLNLRKNIDDLNLEIATTEHENGLEFVRDGTLRVYIRKCPIVDGVLDKAVQNLIDNEVNGYPEGDPENATLN